MKYFVLTVDDGPAWNRSLPMREQDGWTEHAAFMNKLVDEGFIILGGPFASGTRMHTINADSASIIKSRLAPNPWMQKGPLQITKIEPWEILLGNTG